MVQSTPLRGNASRGTAKMQTIDIDNFKKLVTEAKTVCVLMPENPNLDTVASATSLSILLENLGKEVTIAAPSPMLVEANRLVGVQKVTDLPDNKNLTISFQDYDAGQIEKVSYNVEDGQFMLVVSPKPGNTAPNKDQVIVGYKGVAGDLIIVVGAQSKNALGKFAKNEELFGANAKVALVGNTPAEGFANATELINPQSSSVSETLYELAENAGFARNPDVATNLFFGLRAGSNNFQKGVTANTFMVASRLLNEGARLEPLPAVGRPEPAEGQAPQAPVPAEWTQEPKVFTGNRLP